MLELDNLLAVTMHPIPVVMDKPQNFLALSFNSTVLIKRIIFLLAGVSALCMPSAYAAGGGSSSESSLPAQTQSQVDPAQAYQDGLAALQAGDYKTAERRFGEVLSVIRGHPEANYFMGLAKIGREKHKSSIRYFKRAIKERPDFVEAREQLALVYIKLEKPEDASGQLQELNDLLASCETEECSEEFLARLNEAITRVDNALNGTQVSTLSSDVFSVAGVNALGQADSVARYNAAVKLLNRERYLEAIEELYEAQASVGPHSDILNYLGFAHRKLGQFETAKKYYHQALAISPDHLGANEYLGELYLETNDLKRARKQLSKLDELCAFGCAQKEDLARLIQVKVSERHAKN